MNFKGETIATPQNPYSTGILKGRINPKSKI
jgi:hypothetical protein